MSRNALGEAAKIVQSHVARSKPLKKAAVLLSSLSPQITLEVSRDFSERDVRWLLSEMTRLGCSASIETVGVVNEFFFLHRLWPSVGGPLSDADDILSALERWAGRNPRRLARLLKESWLQPRV